MGRSFIQYGNQTKKSPNAVLNEGGILEKLYYKSKEESTKEREKAEKKGTNVLNIALD